MLLSVPAAAAVLQCHEETLRRWIRAKKIKTHVLPGGQVLEVESLNLPPEVIAKLEAAWGAAMERVAARELRK
jgi:excisionase family DNA binding protein